MPRPEVIDHTGQRFGHLTVLKRAASTPKYAAWLCRCDCGQEIVVSGHLLRKGFKKACALNGHRWKPDYSGRAPGVREHPAEYRTFRSMHSRCTDKRRHNYLNYAGRGIAVCERWREFKNFIEDMGPKPALAYTIERKDNNKGYEPDNCRWATKAEQRRNMRNNVYVTRNGERILLMDLAQQLGLNRNNVYARLKTGWSLEDALTVPLRPKKKNRKR